MADLNRKQAMDVKEATETMLGTRARVLDLTLADDDGECAEAVEEFLRAGRAFESAVKEAERVLQGKRL